MTSMALSSHTLLYTGLETRAVWPVYCEACPYLFSQPSLQPTAEVTLGHQGQESQRTHKEHQLHAKHPLGHKLCPSILTTIHTVSIPRPGRQEPCFWPVSGEGTSSSSSVLAYLRLTAGEPRTLGSALTLDGFSEVQRPTSFVQTL